jgi:hypothetical protein
MALLNLSFVTQILMKFLSKYMFESSVGTWGSLGEVPVFCKPPDKIGEEESGLTLYLYHVSEDSQYKNLAATGKDAPPVRYVPMGLNLYYQLSAHGAADEETKQVQLMMGIALKAFHDYPIIDDSTTISGNSIFEVGVESILGEGNKLRIVLQPVPHNEAAGYWNNGSSAPRLSAYYQVSVVLLEAEETASRAGRVLEYGVHTFIQGAPRLDYSQNILSFQMPDATDREITLRPAQVPVGDPVSFSGTGLNGDSQSALLKNSRWKDPVELDPAWAVAVSEDKVAVLVQESADGNVVLPGIFALLVKVVRRSTLRDGSTKDFEHLSNECPFAVTPRIDNVSAIVAGVVTVTGYIFQHVDFKEDAVRIYLGENRLTLVTAAVLNAAEFVIDSALQLRFRLPAALTAGHYPLRIFVNGTESSPRWVEVV